MQITAAMVKQLREMTGAGVMACKNALVETDGDFDGAVDILRKKGEATAVKKAGRIAAEGTVLAVVKEDKHAAIVEVNSETDFVAKNEKFRTFVEKVGEQVLATSAADIDAFMAEAWIEDSSKTVKDELVSQIAVIGENLTIRRFDKIESEGVVAPYIHAGGKIGVLVESTTANTTEGAKEALKNIAMQIAALSPKYTSRNEISADELAKLREITVEAALNDPFSLPKPVLQKLLDKAVNGVWSAEEVAIYEEKKSNMNYLPNFLSNESKAQLAEIALGDKAEIVENKIFNGLVEGRVSKQLKEICLLDQTYVKAEDGKQTVAQYVAQVSKETGAEFGIKRFVRFETGEGIEKKQENFAEEVAKQMNA